MTLVNDVNFMLYTPLLPGAAGHARAAARRGAAARAVAPDRAAHRHVLGADPERRTVRVHSIGGRDERSALRPADRRARLDLALRCRSRAWPSTRIGFKTLAEAIEFRNRLVLTLEQAEIEPDDRPTAASC